MTQKPGFCFGNRVFWGGRITVRWWLLGAGALLVVLWFSCSAMTVVPEPDALHQQWISTHVLALLAGGAFGAGAMVRKREKSR